MMTQHDGPEAVQSVLSRQAIAEFQTLWKKHYKVELPDDQATIRAHQVFGLIRLLTDTPNPAVPDSGVPPDARPPATGNSRT